MAADGVTAKVIGIPAMREALLSLPDKLRKRWLKEALVAGARVVQKEARRIAPRLKVPSPYRTPGLLRKTISVRESKVARRAGNVGVFVNVRPAKGARLKTVKGFLGRRSKVMVKASLRGAKSKVDPFYWRFVEFGTKHMGASKFLQGGGGKLGEALTVFIQKIKPKLDALNNGRGVS